jgi:hypothetical protein
MQTLRVSTKLSRWDITAVNLRLLPRSRGTWIVWGIAALGLFASAVYGEDELSPRGYLFTALYSVLGALFVMLSGLAVCLIFMLLTIKKSGALGPNDYAITPSDIVERTAVTDSQHAWRGVESVTRLGDNLVVKVNMYQMCIIPRRSFDSDAGFDAFVAQAKAWRDEAHAALQLHRN